MPETRTVTITYEYLPHYVNRYWASGGGKMVCSSEGFEDAKALLLERLREEPVVVPPPEEVEVECKS